MGQLAQSANVNRIRDRRGYKDHVNWSLPRRINAVTDCTVTLEGVPNPINRHYLRIWRGKPSLSVEPVNACPPPPVSRKRTAVIPSSRPAKKAKKTKTATTTTASNTRLYKSLSVICSFGSNLWQPSSNITSCSTTRLCPTE